MEDDDLALALALQAEYDREVASSSTWEDEQPSDVAEYMECANKREQPRTESSLQPKSIVDPAWELLDPNPDIRSLFLEFNTEFFWGKLSMVEVKWSPRMTLCAGICCYEGRGGLCSVRLSQPLLKLRPRRDLVETLLHEMIHALLFVTDNNKDHDGHGPEFCKHMHRINKDAGTNITIYHSFHDEVDEMRKHWWRCQGPCRTRPPYYGFVRRAMNRAPSPRDPWWRQHQNSCGGTYVKVKEPENYGKKKNKEKKPAKEKEPSADITPFLSNKTQSKPTSDLRDHDSHSSVPSSSKAISNHSNSGVRLGGDLGASKERDLRGIPSFSRLLNSGASSNSQNKSKLQDATNELHSSHPDHGNTSNDIWGKLNTPTKRKKWLIEKGASSAKGRKGLLTIPEMIARMKEKGTRSVNAGAPAFKTTAPVTKFHSKGTLYFTDSEDNNKGSGSEKENMKIGQNCQKGNFLSNSDPNTHYHGERVGAFQKIHGEINPLTSTQKVEENRSSKPFLKRLSSFDSDDEDCKLSQILPVKTMPDHINRNFNSSLLKKEEKPLLRLAKRLPSFSDDEDCTLSVLVKEHPHSSKNPNKRLRLGQEDPEGDDDNILPEFNLRKDENKPGTDQNHSKNAASAEPPIEKAPCPICCEDVALSKINSHIDECLSVKAIRDSAFM